MSAHILLFRGRGFMSRLIRWQTRSRYSHAALLLPDGKTLIEAWQGAGVRCKGVTSWRNIDLFQVQGLTADQWESAISFAKDQVGKGYDYRAILRFVSRRRMKDNKRWFCSELVFAAFHAAGVTLLDRIEPWAVSPALLSISPRLKPVWN